MDIDRETLDSVLGQLISLFGFFYDRMREALVALTIVS